MSVVNWSIMWRTRARRICLTSSFVGLAAFFRDLLGGLDPVDVAGSVLLGALLALDGADLSAYVVPRVDVELPGCFGDNMVTHPA